MNIIDINYFSLQFCLLSEAAAVSMARIGQAAAHDGLSAGAADSLGRMGEHNAERDAHRFFERWGLKLKIPITYIKLSEGSDHLQVPYLRPSSYLKCLLSRWPWTLFGGPDREAGKLKCGSFWKGLYQSQPTHEAFQHFNSEELQTMLPICVHGDEGTGSKKQPIAIQCFETAFGLEDEQTRKSTSRGTFDSCCCDEACDPKHLKRAPCCQVPAHWPRPARAPAFASFDDSELEELTQQWHATRGHSFLARYLTFVIPTTWLDKGPWVLDGVQAAVADDLRKMFFEGVQIEGQTFRAAVVGLKGDAKWHVRQGRFFRSYMHLGSVRNYPICPDCHAGSDGCPFEETGNSPKWVETFAASLPWHTAGPMETCPFDRSLPSLKYKRDLLHTFKIGLGRDICGSIIMLLCKIYQFFDWPGDKCNVPARLLRANMRFKMWCRAAKECAHLRGFTKDFMHYRDAKSFPYTNSKGSDTMLLLRWLQVELQLAIRKASNNVDILQAALQVCQESCAAFRHVYNHGLWLPRKCMAKLRDHVLKVVRGYSFLAEACLRLNFPAFRYKSTIHSFHHLAVELEIALQSGARCYPNPLIFDCSQPEDFIGRVARVARQTHGRTVAIRSLQRHLVKAKLLLKRTFKQKLSQRQEKTFSSAIRADICQPSFKQAMS